MKKGQEVINVNQQISNKLPGKLFFKYAVPTVLAARQQSNSGIMAQAISIIVK